MNNTLASKNRGITLKQTKSMMQKNNVFKNVLAEDNLRDKYVYNPDKKYYFLSVVYCGDSPRWIRAPFLTESEVFEFLNLYSSSKPNTYSNLQIIEEDLLREKIGVLNKKGDYVGLNLRHWIFDDRYSSETEIHTEILSGTRHMIWKDGYCDWLEISNVSHRESGEHYSNY